LRAEAAAPPLLLALAAAAPLVASEYLLTQLGFILLYAVAGLGLVLLAGHGGQVSLGQAAFLGVGAYAEARLAAAGWPLPLSLAAAMALAGAAGLLASLPAKRLGGLYLAMATLAFGFLVEEALTRWESLTGGARGLLLGPPALGGLRLDDPWQRYLAALCALTLAWILTGRLLASRFGRALRALREDEAAAAVLGIDLWRAKRDAFVIAAALTGLAGALLAHELRVVTPEQFGLGASLELLVLAFVGGVRRRSGALLGAAFVIALPTAISLLRPLLPDLIAQQPGLQPFAFGLALVLCVLFEPQGIAGWLPPYRRTRPAEET
jgi:branched-chain amino acid transport system permease protein